MTALIEPALTRRQLFHATESITHRCPDTLSNRRGNQVEYLAPIGCTLSPGYEERIHEVRDTLSDRLQRNRVLNPAFTPDAVPEPIDEHGQVAVWYRWLGTALDELIDGCTTTPPDGRGRAMHTPAQDMRRHMLDQQLPRQVNTDSQTLSAATSPVY
jgi:hypothetical protein